MTGAPFWNVRDYGVVADGVSDDTAAIHSARDAAGVNGRLYFPAGMYLTTALVASLAGQVWDLHPRATILVSATVPVGTAGLTVAAPDITVRGGVFDGSGIAQQVAVIRVTSAAPDVRLVDLEVQGNPIWYGIAVYGVSGVGIKGCRVQSTMLEGIWVQNSLPAPSLISDISIIDCTVDNSAMPTSSTASGITVYGTSATRRCNRVRISGNTVRLPRGQNSGTSGGIGVIRCDTFSVVENVVDGSNIAITCPSSTRGRIAGNAVRGFNQAGIEFPGGCSDLAISSNAVDPDGQPATAALQASAGPSVNIAITGNVLKGFTGQGANVVNFGSGSAPSRVTVTGNVISASVASGTACGVTFNDAATGIVLSGNALDMDSTPGARAVQFLQSLTGLTATGNEFANAPAGAVQLGSSTSTDVCDWITLAGNTYRSTPAKLANLLSGGARLGSNVSIL